MGARDVRDNDRGTNVTRAVRLNPSELGEDEAVELLTEVLNHVVTLGLTVDEKVETDLLLELDGVVDLLLHRLFVLLLGDLTLAELGTGDTDLPGLGERTDGSGGELGEVETLLLGVTTGREGRLALELLLGDGSGAVTDSGVGSALKLATGSDVLGVLLESSSLLAVEGSGEGGDLLSLLLGESEPADLLSSELGLNLEGDGGVEKRRRGRDNDTVGTELGNSLLGELLGGLEVGLPDVTAGDDTELNADLGGLEGGKNVVELAGFTVQVEVESVNGEVLEELDALTDTAVGGGKGDLGGDRGEGLVDLLVVGTPGLGLVGDKDGLVDLDLLDTSLLELGKELLVDGDELVEERQGLEVSRGVTGLGDEGEVGDGAEKDGAGGDTKSLGLLVLSKLLVVVQLESGLGRVGDLDDVVVGVEELAHLAGNNVDTSGLVLTTTAHGEVGVEGRETLLGVTLGDDTEVERVVQKLVVEGELSAARVSARLFSDFPRASMDLRGDDVNTSVLEGLPALLADVLSDLLEVLSRRLAGPVGLDGLGVSARFRLWGKKISAGLN